MNPTNDVLEQRIAALEGGVGALSLASGTSAIQYALLNILKAGDEFVTANNLYGGTYTMFDAILPNYGITARFTPVNDFAAVEAAINEKTRAIYIEVIGNPSLDVADIDRYSEIARKHHLPLVVDSTFTPPTLFRPIDHGADVVIHSLTKWIGGHGTGIGGIVIDAGKFDWTDPKFALYNEPDGGYHGLRFGHDLGGLQQLAYILRMRTVLLRNLGATLSPDSAWEFHSRSRNVAASHAAPQRECLEGGPFPEESSEGGMGALSGAGGRSFLPACIQVPEERVRRYGGVRPQGRL